MWIWEQDTGILRSAVGKVVGHGYSGIRGLHNVSTAQADPDRGPIPAGTYTIAPPVDTRTHGPYVLWLTPDPSNQMFGRSAFGIHGDSIVDPGSASTGCIILPRAIRGAIWASQDHTLQVRHSSVVVGDQMEVA